MPEVNDEEFPTTIPKRYSVIPKMLGQLHEPIDNFQRHPHEFFFSIYFDFTISTYKSISLFTFALNVIFDLPCSLLNKNKDD